MGYLSDHPNELCVGDTVDGKYTKRKPTALEIQQELEYEDSLLPTVDDIKAQKVRAATDAVQQYINDTAWANGQYGHNGAGNINNCLRYTTHENPWKDECLALLAWSGSCWIKCLEILADVEAETRTEPTTEELISELPIYDIEAMA